MNLSCYVLDDEYHAVNILKDFIQKTQGLTFAGSSASPINAIDEIVTISPNIIFMDIDMPDINGLQVANILNAKYTIIYTTAFREYATEAFEKEAIDYLLKPISYERFMKSIAKTRRFTGNNKDIDMPVSFFVKAGTKSNFIRIMINDILYVKSSANYVEIYTGSEKTLTYLTLNEIMEKLTNSYFSRIHKSYIVNHHFIHSFDYGHVKLTNGTELPIGDIYRNDFKTKVNQLLLVSKREKP
jgi:DNA-binding LytR/AlgR family response regulator